MRGFGWFRRLALRRALQRASQTSAPALMPGVEHVERQVIGTGRDWKASPAVKPLDWTEDIAAHNAAIDREALLERLDLFVAALRNEPHCVLRRNSLLISSDIWALISPLPSFLDIRMAVWAQLYFDCATAQLYAKRQNVTGLQPRMPKLTPDEIADARAARQVADDINALERKRVRLSMKVLAEYDAPDPAWRPTDEHERALEQTIVDFLGGDAQIAAQCNGNPDLIAEVKAKARSLFAGVPK